MNYQINPNDPDYNHTQIFEDYDMVDYLKKIEFIIDEIEDAERRVESIEELYKDVSNLLDYLYKSREIIERIKND